MTTAEFAAKHHVRSTAELVERNPHMSDMIAGSAHWKVTLRHGRKQLTTFYSQGPTIIHEPTAAEVLDCLASDAQSVIAARDFDDWASDLGYDTDSRRAFNTYDTILAQSARLLRFLGQDNYYFLCEQVERD